VTLQLLRWVVRQVAQYWLLLLLWQLKQARQRVKVQRSL
jgi:hypothetical protein